MEKRYLVILALVVMFMFSASSAFARQAFAPTNFFSRIIPLKTTTPRASATPKPIATPRPQQTPRPTVLPTVIPIQTSGMVTITLDDGSKSQYEKGWTIMQKYGLRGTFYVSTMSLDGFWYMTPQMVKNLHAAGNQIAAHTISHRDLTTLSESELQKELVEPQLYLQNLIGAPVTDFASPFGSYNQTVLEVINKYYRSHRTVREGFNTKSSLNSSELLVHNVYSTTSINQITQWVNSAAQNNSWLILVYHEIKENPDQWSVTPDNFDLQMKALKDSGVKVVTVSQALKLLWQ